jgi:D-glycero-alpha-D-manno-heptose 1-phosphate guanylyltransferase
MHEMIEDYVKTIIPAIEYQISLEEEPLGTGGAIYLGAKLSLEEVVLVCNGDTMFKINVKSLAAFHAQKKADCTLVLKPMQDFDRYGVVELNEDNSIEDFKEKKHYREGLINGGVYALNIPRFLSLEFPEKFSFEKDFLEKGSLSGEKPASLFGQVQDQYFIDIGIPEDYSKASMEIGNKI